MRRKASLLAFALATATVHAADETPAPRTLVEINGSPLTELHFALYRNQHEGGQPGTPQNAIALLNRLVNLAILAQQARNEGLTDNPEVAAALEIAQIEVLAQAALRHYINTHPITDEELNKAFAARYSGEPRTEYKARHILVENEEEARALIAELEKGGDFATLAKERSTGPSGPNGGDLGWFEADQMVAPFAEATAQLDKGQFTKTPVKTQFGWHVILLEDRREAPPVKLEDVEEELLSQLHRERAAAYMSEARTGVDVKVTPPPEATEKPDTTN